MTSPAAKSVNSSPASAFGIRSYDCLIVLTLTTRMAAVSRRLRSRTRVTSVRGRPTPLSTLPRGRPVVRRGATTYQVAVG